MKNKAVLFAVLMVLAAWEGAAQTDPAAPNIVKSGLADINDIQIYYQIHGDGEPLLLLHGGLGSSGSWTDQIPILAQEYQVIAMDSRGHGRSTFDDTPFSYELMASDVIGLLDHLGVQKAHLLGWSDGGIIGLHLAISHPERMNRIIAFGANYTHDGVRPDIGENATFITYFEGASADYQKLSPAPERWGEFFSNISSMWTTEPNFTPEQLGAITTPILVLAGKNEEAIYDEHTKEMAGLIPSAELVLMADTGHWANWEKAEEFNRIVLDYLAKE